MIQPLRTFSSIRATLRSVPFILGLLSISCCQAFAGYTHYFTWHEKPDDADLKKCVAEMNLLIEVRKDMLVCPDELGVNPGLPKFGTTNVDFNGVGTNANEPFVFPGKYSFNFCKTEVKPYDEVVTACLIVARDHFPPSVLSISSDGFWDDDWTKGATLYSSVFHRSAKNPIGSSYIPGSWLTLSVVVIALLLLITAVWYWLRKLLMKF
jgi:hypothetical protein